MPVWNEDDIFEEYPLFLYQYEHDGHQWQIEIPAKDWSDAQSRIDSIKESLTLKGSIERKTPAIDTAYDVDEGEEWKADDHEETP
jgi:hypothetical protein